MHRRETSPTLRHLVRGVQALVQHPPPAGPVAHERRNFAVSQFKRMAGIVKSPTMESDNLVGGQAPAVHGALNRRRHRAGVDNLLYVGATASCDVFGETST